MIAAVLGALLGPGIALACRFFYRSGYAHGSAAERLRVRYIFAAAREVVSGGALGTVAERVLSDSRDNTWMQDELRMYIEEKEARRRARKSGP